MKKTLLGCAVGMTVNSLICLISSYALHLGYYAPCFVVLTEPCGGELNAALVQNAAFACFGGLIGCILQIIQNYRRKRTC